MVSTYVTGHVVLRVPFSDISAFMEDWTLSEIEEGLQKTVIKELPPYGELIENYVCPLPTAKLIKCNLAEFGTAILDILEEDDLTQEEEDFILEDPRLLQKVFKKGLTAELSGNYKVAKKLESHFGSLYIAYKHDQQIPTEDANKEVESINKQIDATLKELRQRPIKDQIHEIFSERKYQ